MAAQTNGKKMVLVRDVFHAKFGRGDELVAFLGQLFKEYDESEGIVKSARILTDASGPFFTVVSEAVVDSIEAHRKLLQRSFERADWSSNFAGMIEIVDSGSREYYDIASEYRG